MVACFIRVQTGLNYVPFCVLERTIYCFFGEQNELWGFIQMNSEFVVSISAIFVSVVSLITSIFFSRSARQHNRKSLLPFPYLDRADFEDELRVRLFNKGVGPMIVTSVTAKRGAEKGHLIDIIPGHKFDFTFKNFSRFTDERPILPGECGDLLVAEFDVENTEHIHYRDTLRNFLSECVLTIEYTNVYRTKFAPYVAGCEWFGRHGEIEIEFEDFDGGDT